MTDVDEAVARREAHRRRHVELHRAFDELLADYLRQNSGKLPSNSTLLELLDWSYQQTLNPTEPQ